MMPGVAAAAGQVGTTPYTWVAVGNTGFLATSTSTTASSWTTQTSSFGTTNIIGVASNGLGTFVAVGESGKLALSYNGTDWTQQTSSFGTDAITSVAYGNGLWVAGGLNNKLATSPDGVTWTQRTTGFTGSGTDIRVAYGNGLWVAMSAAEIRTATDPTGTWTLRTSANTIPFNPYYSTLGAIWLAGYSQGTASGIQSSTNGTTWTARSTPNAQPAGVAFAPQFVANSSVIVCWYQTGTSTMDIASSTNGTSWTDRTPAATATSTAPNKPAVDDAGLIVIPGTANNLQTSTDGTTWTGRTGPTTAARGIAHSRVA